MKKQLLFLVLGIAAGGAAVYFLSGSGKEAPSDLAEKPTAVAEVETDGKQGSPSRTTSTGTKTPTASTPKSADSGKSSAWSKLAEKYGKEKTEKSEKIAKNVADLIDEGMTLAQTAAENSNAGSIAEMVSKQAVDSMTTELGLTEEQQAKAAALIQSSVNERMNAVNELSRAMRSEPEQMMELFLAGDALARKEITQEEYDSMTAPTRTMLENISTFVVGNPRGAGNQIFGDEAFTSQLNEILTPDQQAKLTTMVTEAMQQAEANPQRNRMGMFAGDGKVPVMELDKLDETVGSVKTMTAAAKLFMDGMKRMQDASKPKDNP